MPWNVPVDSYEANVFAWIILISLAKTGVENHNRKLETRQLTPTIYFSFYDDFFSNAFFAYAC